MKVKNVEVKKRLGKSLILSVCILAAGLLFNGNSFPEANAGKNKNKTEVLYHNAQEGVKIVKKNNFLLKIEKNEKGLNIVHEMGPYPEAYPDNLPPPKTRIDGKKKQGKRRTNTGQ